MCGCFVWDFSLPTFRAGSNVEYGRTRFPSPPRHATPRIGAKELLHLGPHRPIWHRGRNAKVKKHKGPLAVVLDWIVPSGEFAPTMPSPMQLK